MSSRGQRQGSSGDGRLPRPALLAKKCRASSSMGDRVWKNGLAEHCLGAERNGLFKSRTGGYICFTEQRIAHARAGVRTRLARRSCSIAPLSSGQALTCHLLNSCQPTVQPLPAEAEALLCSPCWESRVARRLARSDGAKPRTSVEDRLVSCPAG